MQNATAIEEYAPPIRHSNRWLPHVLVAAQESFASYDLLRPRAQEWHELFEVRLNPFGFVRIDGWTGFTAAKPFTTAPKGALEFRVAKVNDRQAKLHSSTSVQRNVTFGRARMQPVTSRSNPTKLRQKREKQLDSRHSTRAVCFRKAKRIIVSGNNSLQNGLPRIFLPPFS
jgi:hypothetical protein